MMEVAAAGIAESRKRWLFRTRPQGAERARRLNPTLLAIIDPLLAAGRHYAISEKRVRDAARQSIPSSIIGVGGQGGGNLPHGCSYGESPVRKVGSHLSQGSRMLSSNPRSNG